MLQQFVLTFLQAFHEVLFLRRVFQQSALLGSTVVSVAPRDVIVHVLAIGDGVIELPCQRVVPSRTAIDATQIGILEGIAFQGGRCITQHTDVGQREPCDVHIVVNAVDELFNVDTRCRHLYGHLFLTGAAGSHQRCRTH